MTLGILAAGESAERWIAMEAWLIALDFCLQTLGRARYFLVCQRPDRLSDSPPVAWPSHSDARQLVEIDGKSVCATDAP
jgi:hypothetical protein